jgi:iron complex outermembrane receptor protein
MFTPVMSLLVASVLSASAQTANLSGKVLDENGVGLPGATVQVSPSGKSVATDVNGDFTLTGLPTGAVIVTVSSVGYLRSTASVQLNLADKKLVFRMRPGAIDLDEAVVVGYGTAQKKDLTGAVNSVNAKDFQQGNIVTPEQLVMGKIPGVRINTNGGAPGSGSRIRIRGGSSLNASNDPLIVIDGVPLVDGGISGSANPLSTINPADIENITVLKDASATAIYGSRGANGVILITTKRGVSNALNVEVNTLQSYSVPTGYVDVLSADEFRQVVRDTGTNTQENLLGTANTDWQKEIFRNAFSTDNNIAISGGIDKLPYRATFGYLNQQGILKRSQLDRFSAGLNLSPSLLNDKLKVDLNARWTHSNNFFADQGAIGAAIAMDPTHPVYSDTSLYGGYFEWLDFSGNPNALATRNPVGLLNQKDDESTVNRFIGNVKLDYAVDWVKGLHAIANVGGDFTRSNGSVYIPETAASAFTRQGVNNIYEQQIDNKLLDLYLNYSLDLPEIESRIEATGGYSYQFFSRFSPAYPDMNAVGDTIAPAAFPESLEKSLLSFFGRATYNYKEKYLLTVNVRNDYSSKFSKENRSGIFPSVALAWRIAQENFLKNSKAVSDMKLRLGWGVVGQQDGIYEYGYIPNYSQGTSTGQYQFGSTYYYVLRPDPYDPNLKWEETTTLNAGLDFGFFNNRMYGSVDVYRKTTDDLLAVIPAPAGTNFSNNILTNVGSLENKGFEIALGGVPVSRGDFSVELNANFTYNRNEITKLTKTASDTNDVLVGGISGGVGATVQVHSVGYPAYSFYVYEQKYVAGGQPVAVGYNDVTAPLDTAESIYVDQNGDGIVNEQDLIRYHQPDGNMFFGFSGNVNYKRWSLGFTLRGELGNYVYNNVNSLRGNYNAVGGSVKALNNLTDDYLFTHFKTPQYISSYYVEKASFARMDNISIGYSFKRFLSDRLGLRATAGIQNVFVVTGYSGLDPEVPGGIDNNVYPRPRIYTLGLNLQIK